VRKTVLVLHGDRLSIPAVKTTEQGLMAGLSRGQPEEDLSRFPAAQYGDDLVRYLRAQLDGSAYLQACLASHLPVDLVVIMLGSNDS
jgi:lysophospholipase L1-like esterase